MLHLQACGYRRMPWKNGGGETIEIARHPANATLDDVDWRLSMATITADGAFSTFPELDRTLVILTGAGIELSIEGHPPVTLTCASTPHSFPADTPTTARLIAGPVTDLNVMTRRGAYTHQVRSVALAGTTSLTLESGFLLAGPTSLQITTATGHITLPAGDTLRIDEPTAAEIQSDTITNYHIITLAAVARPA